MRAILFDFGGTLDCPRHWLDRFVAQYRAAGLDINRRQLDPAFSAATRKAYAAGPVLRGVGLSALVEFLVGLHLDHLRLTASRDLSRLIAARGALRDLTIQVRDGFLAESADGLAQSRRVLDSLASHYKLAVVSNFYGNLARVLSEAGFRSIQAVSDSGRLGFYKPDTRLFATALADLQVSPSEAMMVGDSIDKDCAPARAMGMATVWLRHRESNPRIAGNGNHVDFTIDGLEELNSLKWLKH